VIVLLDTDVLIDLALDRKPHSAPASVLLEALEGGNGRGFLAWHSISNFYYLVAPTRGGAGAREFLMDLARFVDVAPTTTASLRFAAGLDLKDFEDALQVAAARACGAEVIATRNLRDYANSPIPARKPAAIAAELLG
jgi:predicted nucleic acid-binding protein